MDESRRSNHIFDHSLARRHSDSVCSVKPSCGQQIIIFTAGPNQPLDFQLLPENENVRVNAAADLEKDYGVNPSLKLEKCSRIIFSLVILSVFP